MMTKTADVVTMIKTKTVVMKAIKKVSNWTTNSEKVKTKSKRSSGLRSAPWKPKSFPNKTGLWLGIYSNPYL